MSTDNTSPTTGLESIDQQAIVSLRHPDHHTAIVAAIRNAGYLNNFIRRHINTATDPLSQEVNAQGHDRAAGLLNARQTLDHLGINPDAAIATYDQAMTTKQPAYANHPAHEHIITPDHAIAMRAHPEPDTQPNIEPPTPNTGGRQPAAKHTAECMWPRTCSGCYESLSDSEHHACGPNDWTPDPAPD